MSPPTRTIDLNADLGEGCPWDFALLDRVTSASIGCGAHAGDPPTIRATLERAQARGVVVGAHPSYADRGHFGRRDHIMSSDRVCSLILGQLDDLGAIAGPLGVPIRFLKPHGALYNQAQREPEIAEGVLAACRERGLPLVGLPGSFLDERAAASGLRYLTEGFCDRRYRPDGSLAPRNGPGAILDDPAEVAAQVLRLVDQGVDTLCIHGDDPRAVGLVEVVLRTLKAAGLGTRAMSFPG